MEAQTSKYEEIFARNSDLARSLGISGTPAFVVGDVVIRGAADLEALKKVVGDVRRRAPR
jgi:protein-disulfide isomerase